MFQYSTRRKAFTMIELMFVIIILGIVASIGSEIIARVYKGYILQRAQHKASIKTELAALQIANRLKYILHKSGYRIRNDGTTETMEISLVGSGDDYKGLLWVGIAGDSFEASALDNRPGWTGFCDINSTDTDVNNIKTQASNLSLATSIINNLSSQTAVGFMKMYFPTATLTPSDIIGAVPLKETFQLSAAAPGTRDIYEHYKVAWSSYALVVENENLYLYYDFPANIDEPLGTKRSLLLNNVSTFKFRGGGDTMRFKLCQNEYVTEDYNVTVCKEKAVF